MNEVQNIMVFHNYVSQILEKKNIALEFIYVCDPSTDGTEECLKALAKKDSRVRIIFMAVRAGQNECIRAGYDFAKGDAVISMDVDFQDPPEMLPRMIDSWSHGNLIVHTKRVDRSSDNFIYRVVTAFGYRFLSWITNGKIQNNVGDFRLIDKSVLDLVKEFKDPNPFWRGITTLPGVQSSVLTHDRHSRRAGTSKYGKLFGSPQLALQGMTSFSYKPLVFLQWLGLLALILSFFSLLFTIVMYFLFPGFPRGIPTLITLLSIFFGFQFFSTSIIATYLIVLIDQTRRRPNYLIRHKD